MHKSLLTTAALLFLLCIALWIGDSLADEPELRNNEISPASERRILIRNKRALFNKKGFIPTLFSVIYEQWQDTKNTFGNINKMINDNFLDESAPVVQTTPSSDPNATTTEAPYKITRKEFQRIIGRNLRGIRRLFNLELQDALRASQKNEREFKKNASKEVSKFL